MAFRHVGRRRPKARSNGSRSYSVAGCRPGLNAPPGRPADQVMEEALPSLAARIWDQGGEKLLLPPAAGLASGLSTTVDGRMHRPNGFRKSDHCWPYHQYRTLKCAGSMQNTKPKTQSRPQSKRCTISISKGSKGCRLTVMLVVGVQRHTPNSSHSCSVAGHGPGLKHLPPGRPANQVVEEALPVLGAHMWDRGGEKLLPPPADGLASGLFTTVGGRRHRPNGSRELDHCWPCHQHMNEGVLAYYHR